MQKNVPNFKVLPLSAYLSQILCITTKKYSYWSLAFSEKNWSKTDIMHQHVSKTINRIIFSAQSTKTPGSGSTCLSTSLSKLSCLKILSEYAHYLHSKLYVAYKTYREQQALD